MLFIALHSSPSIIYGPFGSADTAQESRERLARSGDSLGIRQPLRDTYITGGFYRLDDAQTQRYTLVIARQK